MIKTLLCDLGNVLVFFCHEKMCRQIAEVCGVTQGDVQRHLMQSDLQLRFERGEISEEQLHASLESIFQKPIPFRELVRACSDIFELNASMIPVLEQLKERGIRLVLLSNTCISHIRFIREKWNFLDLFDHLVLSFKVGAAKPEEAIYRAALEHLEATPQETLYIDDIPSYVEQGRQFGLNAEVFTTTARFVETLRTYGISVPDHTYQTS
jgi:HAD superfamily hydrolase (TIGR01509 family)